LNPLSSPGALKVALAVSVALNLFAVAGGVSLWVTKTKVDDKIEAAQAPGRVASFRDIVGGMDPEVRQRVRSTLRASAMAARPDFEASRAARRRAVELSQGATIDPAAVNALLEQSRAAEMRGRVRLEHDTTALLATLNPADRRALAVILSRRGKGAGASSAPAPHPGGPGAHAADNSRVQPPGQPH